MALNSEELVRLLLAHRAMLAGYISLIVRDPHLVEDVLQEVAMVVLRKGADVKEAEGFPAWARTIARYKALNASRNQGMAPQLLGDAVLDSLEADWQAGDGTTPGALSDALQECIKQLPPRLGRLIELRYADNLSGKALADKLGQELNTVYVTLSRVYRALSSCMNLRLSREGLA